MTSQLATIAIFGATGGVANSVLVNALRSGHNVVTLARTPSKLTKQLQAQDISHDILETHLTIITGDALDIKAVKSTLTANDPNHLVTQIVSGLGATPTLRWQWWDPLSFVTIDQPELCGSAAQTLIAALNEIYQASPALNQHKPKLTFVSTTGISSGPEDVPFGMQILYHKFLAVPHIDKRVMEAAFCDNMKSDAPVFSGIIGTRPTLLTGGINADEGVGLEKIRAGTEDKPERGFTVSRADVGRWIWVNAVSDPQKRMGWEGEMVSLTS